MVQAANRTCSCGSGLPRRDLTDARGIFVTFVCDACETGRRDTYRPEIFTDSQYETSEAVDEE